MDSEVNVFISVLKRKLLPIDKNVKFIHQKIYKEPWEKEEFWGGEVLTVRVRTILVDASFVNWLIEMLKEFNFSFEFNLSRYILDPRLKEVELQYRYESNYEFYLKVNSSTSQEPKGLSVYQFEPKFGYHITNCNSSFKEDENEKHILKKGRKSVV